MVGLMIVSLAVALLLAVVDTQSCKDLGENYHDYVDGSCIYLRMHFGYYTGAKQWNLTVAKEVCRNLSEYPYEWRVPKVDTSEKFDRLRAITPFADRMWWYIDLVGDDQMDDSSWSNSSLWYWLPDNTTTLASYDGTVPWGESVRPSIWGGYPKARCASLFKRQNQGLQLWVAVCEQMPPDHGWGATMAACESINVSTTTPPTTTTTTETTTTPTTTTPTTTTTTTTTPTPTSKEAQSPTKPVATGPTDVARSINETQSSEQSSGRYNWAIVLLIGLNVLFCAVVAAIFYKTRNHEYQSLDDGMSGDVIRDGEMPSSSSVNSSSRKVAPRKVKKRK